jgi:hypothetical protein
MKFSGDVDIDFGDRNKILSVITHIPASMLQNDQLIQHKTGIYVTEIPQDIATGLSALDYKTAEQRGYFKLDLLNVNLYKQVTDRAHLLSLMEQQPDWHRLYDKDFFEKLIHVGNHYNTLKAMPEAIDSIDKLSMFLAIIRPGKRHLIGQSWHQVSLTIWDKSDLYSFKRSHGIAYAHLVVVNMNLLTNTSNKSN